MKPFIKWPGGKDKEVSIISRFFPRNFDRYFEPFVGGGAVFFYLYDCPAYDHTEKFINDKSAELIGIYNCLKVSSKSFFDSIRKIQHNWDLLETVVNRHSNELLNYYHLYQEEVISFDALKMKVDKFLNDNAADFNGVMSDPEFNPCIDLFIYNMNNYICRRFKRLKVLAKDNILTDSDILNSIETAAKGTFYNHYRYIYNNRNKNEKIKISDQFSSAIYYFIRENCYASMFRYNKYGDFNIPYGGMAYNKKNISSKILNPLLVDALKDAHIARKDYRAFLDGYDFTRNDFIFIDPPYDSDFSKYSNEEFEKDNHEELCDYLSQLDANIMIVIKKTEFIENLYRSKGFYIYEFSKKYLVNCKNRNDRNVMHLIITNYPVVFD